MYVYLQVKVLGVLGMIDSDELDWKLIAINKDDELAPSLNDITDLEKMHPEVISGNANANADC